MTDLLRNRPGTTQAMIAVFDDAATLAHALAFGVELAHAQAANGVIRSDAAEGIARACRQSIISPDELANRAALDGEDLRGLPLSMRKTNLTHGIFVAPFASVPIEGNPSSTERWNDVPRGTMDEVSSHVRLKLPFKSAYALY